LIYKYILILLNLKKTGVFAVLLVNRLPREISVTAKKEKLTI